MIMAFKFIAILLLEITLALFSRAENGLPVKSIQSEDGDVIDCIDIFKQPALSHPALKNHKIQMRPSDNPVMENSLTTKTDQKFYKFVTTQIWQKNGNCPKGTVPIRRTQKKKDQLKKPSFFHRDNGLKSKKDIYLSQMNHSVSHFSVNIV
uniref:Neprosin activation peptide domain-containing protein n=1 Tax=Nicotiana tabacum TaxID=4097 RepID=A0A1S4AHQ9_TOBAC|nr:PREDICTED: uncharacterized protein LOC107797575 [Nicotiana tabacum]